MPLLHKGITLIAFEMKAFKNQNCMIISTHNLEHISGSSGNLRDPSRLSVPANPACEDCIQSYILLHKQHGRIRVISSGSLDNYLPT